MADPKIRIRRSATPNKVPTTTQLQLGELAINTYDGKVYLEQDQGGVGVGITVIAVNPWSVGVGSTAYNTHFTAGKVGVGTTNAQYNLDVGGDINFTGNLYQDGSAFTSGVGIRTAGGTVGWAATIIDFRGPGVTTAYYSSSTGIGTVYFQGGGGSGGGGNASVTVSDSAPSSPSNGDLWFKSDVGELYLWYTDGSSNQWVEASGGSNTVITSDTPPSSPNDGDLWWNSNTGELKIYYNDGNSSQWVDANSEGGFVQYWTQTNTNGTLGVTTTSYVGIGTTTATDALTVRGNANVTGFLTATQLNGAVSSTGVNVTGVATALHLKGPVTSSGVNVTGVATALQLKGPLTSSGINVTGISTFSGDVKIGGVLTYEDVKNVDAIGIVTARKGIKALAGGANIVDGTTTDQLNVTGISTFAGNIDVNADLDVDGHTELDNVNVVGIATIQQVKATTLNVTGVSTVTGGVKVGTAATICSEGNMTIDRPSAGIITATKFIGDGSDLTGVISGIGIGTAGGVVGYAATIVHFKGAGVTTAYYNAATGIGTVFFHSTAGGGGGNANVTISDTAPGSPSAGDLWWESDIGELKIYYSDGDSSQWVDASGADSLVQIGTSAPTGAVSGDLWFNSETGDFMVYYTDANSSAWISVNAVNSNTKWLANSTGIHTSSYVGIGTTTVTDALTVVGATDLDGRLIVSGITTFGSHVYHGDGDRDIYGDGSDLQIYHSGSHSFLQNSTGSLISEGNSVVLRSTAQENYLVGTANGAVDLYYDNSKKFETTNTGATVTGTLIATSFSGDGSGLTGVASTEFVSAQTLNVIGVSTFKGDVLWDNSTNAGKDILWDESDNSLNFSENVSIKLNDASGGQNASLSNGGSGLSIAAFSGGTVKIAASGGTWIRNQAGEFNIKCNSNASTDLYYANVKTFETVSGGAKVTGNLEVTGNTNILGTLTYEDVKNVDSVGIATARQGLRITGGGLDVVGVSTFNDNVKLLDDDVLQIGTGADLQIWHNGSTNVFDSAYNFDFKHGSEYVARLGPNGNCEFYWDSNKKLETTSSGVEVTGGIKLNQSQSTINLDTSDGSDNKFLSIHGGGAASQSRGAGISLYGNEVSSHEGKLQILAGNSGSANGVILMYTGGAERLRIGSAGRVLIGTTTEGHGNADDLTIATAGGTLGHTGITIRSGTSSDGNIFFSDATSGDGETKGVIKYSHNGDFFRFNTAGDERVRITSDGQLCVTGTTSGVDTTPPLNGFSAYYETDQGQVTLGTYSSGGTTHMAFYTNESGNAMTQKMCLQGNGSLGLGVDTPTAGDLASGASFAIPKMMIQGPTSDSSHHLLRLNAGTDADWNGGILTINHSNDRGIAIYGGRSTSNRSWGAIRSIDNIGRVTNAFEIIGASGQGVERIVLYTGDSTSTTERLRITSDGQFNFTTNKSSGYIAKFTQSHADNVAEIWINSPADNNLRPAYIQLQNAGTNKWGIGQVYQSTSSGAFHIAAGGHSQANSKFTITTGGRIFYGNHINDRGAELQYEGDQHACIGIHRNTANHGAPAMIFSASRGTSAGSNTVVQSGDYLGMLTFKGADGSDLASGAYITAIVDGTPGSNDMPTRLGFWTSADGSQSPTERLRITSNGTILSGTTNTDNLSTGGMKIQTASVGGNAVALSLRNPDLSGSSAVSLRFNMDRNSGGIHFNAAEIKAVKETTWTGGASTVDGSLEFSTIQNENLTTRMKIASDGGIFFIGLLGNASSGSNVKLSNSDWELRYDTSSKLLKTNITPLTKYGIDTVKKLKPCTFKPQEYELDGTITVTDETLIGFLADEMVEEVPEVVQLYQKHTLTKNPDDTEVVPAAISYDKLTVVLTKALQEAIAKIETLETKVASLESS